MLERIENQRQELKRQMRAHDKRMRMRHEFTANMTHELKTPLTAISGYAELIGSGMVASEDDQRDFAMRIYKEAGRLTSLVNDILTLSNLDEAEHSADAAAASVLGTREPVDLPLACLTPYIRDLRALPPSRDTAGRFLLPRDGRGRAAPVGRAGLQLGEQRDSLQQGRRLRSLGLRTQ